ncbi:MAG: MOSC domain-containing protein [Phycisphaerae bacterium]
MSIALAQIQAIAIKTASGGPMREVAAANVEIGGGIIGGEKPSAKRGVTFISSIQWTAVMQLLGSDKPWHTRRANVLVDAARLDLWFGKTVRVGTALIRIHAETRPCELMNEFVPGLLEALKPECRAGVYGEVLEAGQFAVGDAVTRME